MQEYGPIWFFLLAIVSAGAALAQAGPSSVAPRKANPDAWTVEADKRTAECMAEWDPRTHMTKKEWERTCRRVTNDRLKYLREQGHTLPSTRQQP